jgi:altronate hydrolase
MTDQLLLHPADTVAILTRRSGTIPAGHKIARAAHEVGAPVVKFGQIIGVATAAIATDDHVHSHNLGFADLGREQMIGAGLPAARAAIPDLPMRRFDGYLRRDGRVGTRNMIALVATVNCSATVIRRAASEIEASGLLRAYPSIDGICAFAHGTGCGMADSGAGADILQRVLWGHATHPNVGAAIFVGLGCEVMQIARMKAAYGVDAADRFHGLTIQDSGGTRATIDAIKAKVAQIAPMVAAARRELCPVSALKIGLQCGGSDGFSGITANPALGLASDMIVGLGGTVILSETPEIYGAEQLLLRRAATRDVGARLLTVLRWWEGYTALHGASLDNNPSPGNKAGGLTTILEKSLGAVAKGGNTPLNAVYDYAQQVIASGLTFMDTPGYDPVSATGQIAGGAQVIVFTTGRGSAFGSKPAPTIKLSTNTALATAMPDDIDLDCGDVLTGCPLQDKAEQIVAQIIAVASGRQTASEQQGLGDHEFVPWQIGAVL